MEGTNMYEKIIEVDKFEEIEILTWGDPEVELHIVTLYGRASLILEIEEAKRLRNYLTEAINFATLNKEEV